MTEPTRRDRFLWVALASLALALSCAFLPRLVEPVDPFQVATFLTLAWVVLLISAFATYRRRALWLLIGAPAALFWPGVVVMIGAACAANTANCP